MNNITCPQCKGKGLILIPGEFKNQCTAFSFRDRNQIERLEKCPTCGGAEVIELRACDIDAQYEIERLQSEVDRLHKFNMKLLDDNCVLLQEIKRLRGEL